MWFSQQRSISLHCARERFVTIWELNWKKCQEGPTVNRIRLPLWRTYHVQESAVLSNNDAACCFSFQLLHYLIYHLEYFYYFHFFNKLIMCPNKLCTSVIMIRCCSRSCWTDNGASKEKTEIFFALHKLNSIGIIHTCAWIITCRTTTMQ